MFKIPIEEKDLKIIEASDSCDILIRVYNEIRESVNGKTISDVANVCEQLSDWIQIDRAEMIIPYKHGKPRQEPMGHRIWYLSNREGNYYHGCFFDLKVSKTSNRRVVYQCKLSTEAIKMLNNPQVKENLHVS